MQAMDDYVQNNIPTSVTGFVNDLYLAKKQLLEADTEAERKRGILARSSSLKELSLHKRRFIADSGKQLIRDGMVHDPVSDSFQDDSDARRFESRS